VNELALFAGAGGGILAARELGWRTVCAVELDRYARAVLMARQDDGSLEPFPVWDDVSTFDGRPWAGLVDVVSGGFPCQDISVAGSGAGIDGARSGLWREMARIIGEVRPRFCLVENSPALVTRGLGTVLGDLAALGYNAEWGVLGASDVGAPHRRQRIWILAHADLDTLRHTQQRAPTGRVDVSNGGRPESRHDGAAVDVADAAGNGRQSRRPESGGREGRPAALVGGGAVDVADADSAGREQQRRPVADGAQHATAQRGSWWAAEPDVGRVAHGVASRVDRLRCLGNGQVPACAAEAWRQLIARVQ
jgi:DNA (cytosine-5)-methyltransferase 1